ncbi:MAG: hypothetical protein V1792_28820 [Pseudomonadota bacterium]
MTNEKMHKLFWKKILFRFGPFALVIIVVTCEIHTAYFRNFPTDEEMIENFNKHRQAFEQLVQIYQEDPAIPINIVATLLPTSEVEAIMKRIKVSNISDDQCVWIPPNPYSAHPRSQIYRTDGHETRKFSGVVLSYVYEHRCAIIPDFLLPNISKKYYYIPLVPKVVNGKLSLPAHLLAYGDGPLVESLNTCPPGIGPFGCAYRQIEPHWFIRMYYQ